MLRTFAILGTAAGLWLGVAHAIEYDATMVLRGERSAHTSICPSLPGMLGNEQGMDPIIRLELSGFRKADSAGFSCD